MRVMVHTKPILYWVQKMFRNQETTWKAGRHAWINNHQPTIDFPNVLKKELDHCTTTNISSLLSIIKGGLFTFYFLLSSFLSFFS